MLDANRAFIVPALPGVAVYPDDRLTSGFYPVATVPAVVIGADGTPEIGLTVYGRRTAGVFRATGGIVTVTTCLVVGEQDRADLTVALARRVAEGWPSEAGDPPTVQLLAASWLDGSVDLRLTADVTATGRPALSGDNRCSFSIKLSAEHADALDDAWSDGLPEATIRYAGRLQAAGAGRTVSGISASFDSSIATEFGGTAASGWALHAESARVGEGSGADATVEASAPLAASLTGLADRRLRVEL